MTVFLLLNVSRLSICSVSCSWCVWCNNSSAQYAPLSPPPSPTQHYAFYHVRTYIYIYVFFVCDLVNHGVILGKRYTRMLNYYTLKMWFPVILQMLCDHDVLIVLLHFKIWCKWNDLLLVNLNVMFCVPRPSSQPFSVIVGKGDDTPVYTVMLIWKMLFKCE